MKRTSSQLSSRLIVPTSRLLVPIVAAAFAAGCAPKPYVRVADKGALAAWAGSGRFGQGSPRSFHVSDTGETVFFLRGGAQQDLWEFDVASGRETPLVSAAKLLDGASETLSEQEKALMERLRSTTRGIRRYAVAPGDQTLMVPLGGRLFIVDRGTGKTRELRGEANGAAFDAQFSPDGRDLAYVKSGDLYVSTLEGQERRLTHRKGRDTQWGMAEFIAQEEMSRYHGFWWSPDGAHLVVQFTDTSAVDTLWIADPRHPERRPSHRPYPRAGRANAIVRLAILRRDGIGGPVWIQWPAERLPYLVTVRWSKAGPLTLVVQDRAQRELRILEVEPATGQTHTLHVERDAAWLNIDQSFPHWIDNQRFVWASERSGSWQLELRSRQGKRLKRLTPPGFGYRGVMGWQDDGVVVRQNRPSPMDFQLSVVPWSGGAPRPLTDALGAHLASMNAGPGRNKVFVHTYTDPSGVRRSDVRRVNTPGAGPVIANRSATPPYVPHVEFVTVDVGPKSDRRHLQAALVRPRNAEPGRKYPVVMYVYGGPGYQVVTRNRRRYFSQQFIADHGFVVVMIDGRGTPGHGRAFERVIQDNVIEPGMEDQILGLRALGRRFEELDLSRVGIYGWSFGGYFAAHAVMRHPEIFKVGFAGAPVADWRDYDTHYTERYMGLPQEHAEAYQKTSALTYAKDLSRPLLIAHGTADDNVYMVNTLRLSEALFRAGKPHGVLPLAGFTHMVYGKGPTVSLYRLIAAHFVGHLKP